MLRYVFATALVALAAAAPASAKAPAKYTVAFKTTKGTYAVTVTRAWAPRGADRFYQLVKAKYFDGDRLFRVLPTFVVQWGISPQAATAQKWANATIKDDPVKHSNVAGTITFAAGQAPNTRSTQVFVNMVPNKNLDALGFAPFGTVTSGMKVFKKLYSGYGEQPTSTQGQMIDQGDVFVKRTFPKLDRIVTARVTR
jgi:peptidyl-prolyl cis-trans isomerase A (cyclophilin A)